MAHTCKLVSRRFALLAAFLAGTLALVALSLPAGLAQKRNRRASESHSPAISLAAAKAAAARAERALKKVCDERTRDPFGSIPIDDMQRRPSLPVAHPSAVAGAKRAGQLLEDAKRLTIGALRALGKEYKINPRLIQQAAQRIEVVDRIKPDMQMRDNASVNMRDPRTIVFGTIFLASLKSDEGMLSVLSHEIVHHADGRDEGLAPLFQNIGARARFITGLRITGNRPEELTCDLVGAVVVREYVAENPSEDSLVRRLSRSLQHNCVETDSTDEDHLSPRNTMRSVLALDEALARLLLGEDQAGWLRPLVLTSLTTFPASSYHPRLG